MSKKFSANQDLEQITKQNANAMVKVEGEGKRYKSTNQLINHSTSSQPPQ